MVVGEEARLSSQESRRLARPLHSDSLPENTQIREQATEKREDKRPRLAQRGPKGNAGLVNSHTDPIQALLIVKVLVGITSTCLKPYNQRALTHVALVSGPHDFSVML